MVAGSATFLVSALAAVSILARSHWYFGSSDLHWFLFWSLPLCVVVAQVAPRLTESVSTFRLALPIAFVVGVTTGLGWCFLVTAMFGLWIGAVSVPFWFIWPFAAPAGLAAQLGFPSMRRAAYSGAFCMLMTLLPLASVEAWPYVAGWQVLTVVKMKLIAPSATLSIVNDGYLTPLDIDQMKADGVTGVIEVIGTSTIGLRGPAARALVVSTASLDRELTVNQPRGTTAVYIQERDQVRVLPQGVPLHRWHLRFESRPDPDSRFLPSVNIVQEHAEGWSGGQVIHWGNRPPG